MIYIILVDIFNSDFCTPALSGDNNIIFKDRKTDIYPNKITLCKDSCEYKSVNIEEQRNVCECNLNINKENNTDNVSNVQTDNGNFFTYLEDNINYKIFKYYSLINFNNLKSLFVFYVISAVFLIIIVLSFIF